MTGPSASILRAQFLIAGFAFQQRFFFEHCLFAARQLVQRRVQFLAAGFVEIFELGLSFDQIEFDLRAPILRRLNFDAQGLEALFQGQQLCAVGALLRRQLADYLLKAGDLFGQLCGSGSSSMLSESRRARSTPRRSVSAPKSARRFMQSRS